MFRLGVLRRAASLFGSLDNHSSFCLPFATRRFWLRRQMEMYSQLKLKALQTVVDELHSRFEDGINPFDREEPAVGRLVCSLDDIVNTDLYDAGGAFVFLETALQQIPEAPAIHQPFQKAKMRQMGTKEESFRFWMICALDHPETLAATLEPALQMIDIVEAFYKPESVLRNAAFCVDFVKALKLIHHHRDCGTLHFTLDISALALFHENSRIRHVDASEARPHRRPRPSDAKLRDPNKPRRRETITRQQADRVTIDCSTQVSIDLTTIGTQTTHVDETRRATMTEDGLYEMEQQIIERDKVNRAMSERLRRQEDSLEERKEQIELTLASLRRLYSEHVLLVKQDEEEGRAFDPAKMSIVLPKIIGLLANESELEAKAGGPTSANARTPLSKVKQENQSFDRDLEQKYTRSFAKDTGTAEFRQADEDTRTVSSHTPSVASTQSSVDAAAVERRLGHAKPFSWCAPPDTMPVKVLGDRPWQLTEIMERERASQLTIQGYLCAGCRCSLPQDKGSNALFAAIQKVGQKALGDKPRRCHYCGEHYCHKCHTNKTALLPFRVLGKWDFAEQHVCNRDHLFLQSNFDRPIIHLPSTPVSKRPLGQKVATLRQKTIRMYAVFFNCPDARGELGSLVTSYYFSREHWYSLSDMVRLRNSEGVDKASLLPFSNTSERGSGSDLISLITAMLEKADRHIRRCKSCSVKAIVRCTLCSGGDPVCLYDLAEAATCARCSRLYHASCLDVMGCKCREEDVAA